MKLNIFIGCLTIFNLVSASIHIGKFVHGNQYAIIFVIIFLVLSGLNLFLLISSILSNRQDRHLENLIRRAGTTFPVPASFSLDNPIRIVDLFEFEQSRSRKEIFVEKLKLIVEIVKDFFVSIYKKSIQIPYKIKQYFEMKARKRNEIKLFE